MSKKMKQIAGLFDADACKTKEDETGKQIGIVSGYASTFGGIDRVGDTIDPAAFNNTIKDHFSRGNRGIRILYNHDRDKLLGHAPIELVRVDGKGLYIEAHLNLEVELARDVYSFVKQGVLRDFSIGYIEKEYSYNTETGVNTVLDVDLLETSIVNEPANPEAEITDVKHIHGHTMLPLAERSYEWDAEEALERVKEFIGSDGDLTGAFLWSNDDNEYKLLISDVIDGELKAVPHAVYAVAAELKGLRGESVSLSDADKVPLQKTVSKYYAKMGLTAPFGDDLTIDVSDVETVKQISDVETMLEKAGFTKNARKAFIARVKSLDTPSSREDLGTGTDREDSVQEALKAANSLTELLKTMSPKN